MSSPVSAETNLVPIHHISYQSSDDDHSSSPQKIRSPHIEALEMLDSLRNDLETLINSPNDTVKENVANKWKKLRIIDDISNETYSTDSMSSMDSRDSIRSDDESSNFLEDFESEVTIQEAQEVTGFKKVQVVIEQTAPFQEEHQPNGASHFLSKEQEHAKDKRLLPLEESRLADLVKILNPDERTLREIKYLTVSIATKKARLTYIYS